MEADVRKRIYIHLKKKCSCKFTNNFDLKKHPKAIMKDLLRHLCIRCLFQYFIVDKLKNVKDINIVKLSYIHLRKHFLAFKSCVVEHI